MDHKENGKKPQNTKSKRFLVIYSVALFLFAGVLICLSYFSQARVASETDKMRQELKELSEKTEVAAGVQTRLEQVSSQNDDLIKANSVLKEENESLKKQLDSLQGQGSVQATQIQATKAQAADYLWRIVKAYSSEDIETCNQLLQEFHAKNLRSFLSAEGQQELTSIEKSLKS